MNQFPTTFQELVEREARVKAQQKQRRRGLMGSKEEHPLRPRSAKKVAERFLKKVNREGNGCHEWIGWIGKPKGQTYGYPTFNMGFNIKAHKVAYLLLVGPVRNGMSVLHHCDNPACCNPDHLFLGTQRDNMLDKRNKRRGNGQKIGPEQAQEIRDYYRSQIPNGAKVARNGTRGFLSKKYGLSIGVIKSIIRGTIWKPWINSA